MQDSLDSVSTQEFISLVRAWKSSYKTPIFCPKILSISYILDNFLLLFLYIFFENSWDIWGLPRGLSDKRHCVKMWRQFVTKVTTADRSWHERSDNLRKRQSIFHFDKATTALFFFDGYRLSWLDKASVTLLELYCLRLWWISCTNIN